MCILTFNGIDRHVEYTKRSRPCQQIPLQDKNFFLIAEVGGLTDLSDLIDIMQASIDFGLG